MLSARCVVRTRSIKPPKTPVANRDRPKVPVMRTRRKFAWLFISCGIALVLLLTLWPRREPQYKGRSLTQWAILLNGGYANEPDISRHDAEEAIRHIGTNGLPFYLKWLLYKETPWRIRLANQAARLPGDFG